MPTQKILWMADESIESSRPEDWNSVFALTQKLADGIIPVDMNSEVVNPIVCWDSLVPQLRGKNFTTIIDLSGFFTPSLHLYSQRPQ